MGSFCALVRPSAPVLIWDVSPTEVRQRGVCYHAENLKRINTGLDDGSQVSPVVTEIEHIDELMSGLKLRQMLPGFVEDAIVVHIRVRCADSRAVRELEFV